MIYAGLCCCDLIFSGRDGKFLWLALSVLFFRFPLLRVFFPLSSCLREERNISGAQQFDCEPAGGPWECEGGNPTSMGKCLHYLKQ